MAYWELDDINNDIELLERIIRNNQKQLNKLYQLRDRILSEHPEQISIDEVINESDGQ